MIKGYKVMICIIIAVWLFGMGILTGEYKHRNAVSEPGGVSVTNKDSGSSGKNNSGTNGSGSPGSAQTPGSDSGEVTTNRPSTVATTRKVAAGELLDGRFTSGAVAIRNNCFCIKGRQYVAAEGNIVPLEFATNGVNSQVIAEISGIEIAMLIMDENMYLIYDGNYLRLTKTVMSTVGVDLDDYNFDSSFITRLFDENAEAKVEKATLDDKKVTKTSYNCSAGRVVLYSDGDKLLQIEQYYLETDELIGIIYVDEILSEIPEGMLTIEGLKKKSLISFFKILMDNTDI